MVSHFFYSTGHQCTVPAIRSTSRPQLVLETYTHKTVAVLITLIARRLWCYGCCRFEAAYVGFVGDHTIYAIPATLIVLHTFASHVIGALALPLLLFWPQFRGISIQLFDKKPSGFTFLLYFNLITCFNDGWLIYCVCYWYYAFIVLE